MSFLCNILSLAFLFVFAVADEDFQCVEDEDCPKYHYCTYSYVGINYTGSQCFSNLDATFGPACNGDDNVCQENDKDEASSAVCIQHEGQYGCRKSYFLPFDEASDCAKGFGCEPRTFQDGEANVCVPGKWYNESSEECETNHDCGYSILFGHKWMPCRGRCLIVQTK